MPESPSQHALLNELEIAKTLSLTLEIFCDFGVSAVNRNGKS